MWTCSSCKSENPDSSKVCQSCGAQKPIPKSYEMPSSYSSVQQVPNLPINNSIVFKIFDEETIKNISLKKLQVDEEKAKESKERADLLDYTIQCLKEFPVIATRIELKKIDKGLGWGMVYLKCQNGYVLYDYPLNDKIITDGEIKEFAKRINASLKDKESVKNMIISALIGKPILLE